MLKFEKGEMFNMATLNSAQENIANINNKLGLKQMPAGQCGQFIADRLSNAHKYMTEALAVQMLLDHQSGFVPQTLEAADDALLAFLEPAVRRLEATAEANDCGVAHVSPEVAAILTALQNAAGRHAQRKDGDSLN